MERTETHVPPKAAGNRGESRSAVFRTTEAGQLFDMDSARYGGMRGFWSCTECNGEVGRWDQEYLKWHARIEKAMFPGGTPRALPVGELPDADPGAFVRAIWAWAFFTDETESLHASHRALAHAIKTGDAIEPPSDLRLHLAVTTSRTPRIRTAPPGAESFEMALTGDGWSRQGGLWTPGPASRPLPPMVVVSPPFVVVLVATEHDQAVPLWDVSDWIAEPARQRRAVALDLACISVRGTDKPFVRYDDLVAER